MKTKTLRVSQLSMMVMLMIISLLSYSQTYFKVVPGLGKAVIFQTDLQKSAVNLGFGGSLPTSASLEKFCPPVVFQGENAYTCTGWSVAYAGHTIRQAVLDNQSPPKLVFDAMFLFNSLRGSNYELCNYGVPLDDAVVFLNEVGSIPYHIPEMDCQSDISAEMTALAAKNRIKGYELLYSWNEENEQDVILPIKRALSEGKPVVCNILTWFPPKDAFKARSYSPSFWYVEDVWEPRASELDWNQSHYAGPHNVVIVGYDDQLYGGALRIMNSYGNDWGDKGFFWIRYSDFFRVANGGFAIY